jgi:hypothetical protein
MTVTTIQPPTPPPPTYRIELTREEVIKLHAFLAKWSEAGVTNMLCMALSRVI